MNRGENEVLSENTVADGEIRRNDIIVVVRRECSAQSRDRQEAGPNCRLQISDCGLEEVVSGQFSVISRVFSGDPLGSALQLQISDCGVDSQRRERQRPVARLRIADFGLRNGRSCRWSVFSCQ